MRDAIGQALIRLDVDEAIAGAVRLFESDDAQLRNLGVDVLRHKGDRSIPFLRKAIADGDRDMRKFVLDVLSGIQSQGTADIYASHFPMRIQTWSSGGRESWKVRAGGVPQPH